jgi:hypothetical protein
MAGLPVPTVVRLGVHAVELTQTRAKVGVRGFQQQVVVIVHEAVSVTQDVVSFHH